MKKRNSLINLKKHQYEEINNQRTEETSEKCSDIIIFQLGESHLKFISMQHAQLRESNNSIDPIQ